MTPKNTTKKLRKSAEQWILDRSTLRRIEKRTTVNYSTKWRNAQKYAEHIPTPLENLGKNLFQASRILMLDGTFTKVNGITKCIHIAYDTGIGVIDYWIDDSENKTAYWYLLRRVEEKGYKPIICLSDGNTSILQILKEKNIPHQQCIFHLLQFLRRELTKKVFGYEIPKPYKVLYSRIKFIFKAKNLESVAKGIENIRILTPCFTLPKQKKVLKWFWKNVISATIRHSYNEDIPSTTNQLENLNGQIKQRIKTMRGLKSEESLNKILKILFYFKNFK